MSYSDKSYLITSLNGRHKHLNAGARQVETPGKSTFLLCYMNFLSCRRLHFTMTDIHTDAVLTNKNIQKFVCTSSDLALFKGYMLNRETRETRQRFWPYELSFKSILPLDIEPLLNPTAQGLILIEGLELVYFGGTG